MKYPSSATMPCLTGTVANRRLPCRIRAGRQDCLPVLRNRIGRSQYPVVGKWLNLLKVVDSVSAHPELVEGPYLYVSISSP